MYSPAHKANKPRYIDTAAMKISMEVSKTENYHKHTPKEAELAPYTLAHSVLKLWKSPASHQQMKRHNTDHAVV